MLSPADAAGFEALLTRRYDEIAKIVAAIDVRDPLAARLKALSDGADTPEGKVAALLSVREVFSSEVAEKIAGPVTAAYTRLVAVGARAAVAEALE